MHAKLKYAAALGEEEHRCMRMRDQEMLGVVLLTRACRCIGTGGRPGTFEAHAASSLGAERPRRLALDVAPMRESDHDFFLRDQVLGRKLAGFRLRDFGPALVAVLFGDLLHLLVNQEADL